MAESTTPNQPAASDKGNKHTKSGLALAGVIVGAIAVALAAIPIINNFAFVLAVLALVFGIVGLRQTSKGKRAGRGRAVTATVLAVVAVVVVLASQSLYGKALDEAGKELDKTSAEVNDSLDKASGKKTDELLKNDVSVELGTFTATTKDYVTETALPVKVSNKNTAAKSYSVQVEGVDVNGVRIADDTLYANALNPGQTQEFKMFQFVQSDKVDQLKAATFKIVSVSQN